MNIVPPGGDKVICPPPYKRATSVFITVLDRIKSNMINRLSRAFGWLGGSTLLRRYSSLAEVIDYNYPAEAPVVRSDGSLGCVVTINDDHQLMLDSLFETEHGTQAKKKKNHGDNESVF